MQADAFFGGYLGWDTILRWLDAAGVRWVQLSGTGVDKVPPEIFDGRIVTCARGASAVPISEWVLAAILAWAKRMPETFLAEPPKYWNFPIPPLDRVEGATLALVGLGGIGARDRDARAGVRHARAGDAAHRRAEPGRRASRSCASLDELAARRRPRRARRAGDRAHATHLSTPTRSPR